ncbi:MAG: TolC family protein [Sulfuricella sp.]|jgi:outer membrane protein TolC
MYRINKSALRHALLAALLGAAMAPIASFAEALPLSKLEENLASSLRLKAMETQIDYAQHVLRQQQSREGMQISGRLDAGHHRQIVTSNLTRNYDALQPHVALSYPLLGGRAQQLEATRAAQTQTRLSSIDFDDMRRQLLHQLRQQYILYWQYSQAEQLAAQYLESLRANEAAASKLHEKGMWTSSEFLHFSNSLAAAGDELQRFRALQRVALNTMHSIVGQRIGAFQSVQPVLPQPCLSSAGLNQSAERHSAELGKLAAQREALAYNREIGAGSSVNAALHLGLGYTSELANDRQGYAATAGVSISMPAGFQEAERANRDRLNAALVVNQMLSEQARLDLQLDTAQAYENLQLARNRLEVAKSQAQTAREALREAKMQFERLPHPVFNELMQKISQEYQAALAEIESHSQSLQKTSDLLLLAPDSCAEADSEQPVPRS